MVTTLATAAVIRPIRMSSPDEDVSISPPTTGWCAIASGVSRITV
jgi:hypothetical protein